mmetsp:Transcript_21724/g.51293  ORF Transcript_21724/g.51293 Transcript_21724/m.51293 type:complete len:350 (+) Transcript_21724:190-1239(+)
MAPAMEANSTVAIFPPVVVLYAELGPGASVGCGTSVGGCGPHVTGPHCVEPFSNRSSSIEHWPYAIFSLSQPTQSQLVSRPEHARPSTSAQVAEVSSSIAPAKFAMVPIHVSHDDFWSAVAPALSIHVSNCVWKVPHAGAWDGGGLTGGSVGPISPHDNGPPHCASLQLLPDVLRSSVTAHSPTDTAWTPHVEQGQSKSSVHAPVLDVSQNVPIAPLTNVLVAIELIQALHPFLTASDAPTVVKHESKTDCWLSHAARCASTTPAGNVATATAAATTRRNNLLVEMRIIIVAVIEERGEIRMSKVVLCVMKKLEWECHGQLMKTATCWYINELLLLRLPVVQYSAIDIQ